MIAEPLTALARRTGQRRALGAIPLPRGSILAAGGTSVEVDGGDIHGRSRPFTVVRGLDGGDLENLVARITARAVASVLADPSVRELLDAVTSTPKMRVLG